MDIQIVGQFLCERRCRVKKQKCSWLLVAPAAILVSGQVARSGESVHLAIRSRAEITKLQSLGFQQGIKVTRGHLGDLPGNARGVLFFQNFAPTENQLTALHRFVMNGGRAVLMYHRGWVNSNNKLQDLFQVSVSQECVFKETRKSIMFPADGLPALIESLKIGVDTGHGYSAIRAFLTALAEGEKRAIVSSATGKSRLLSTSFPLGKGEVLFMPILYSKYSTGGTSRGWVTTGGTTHQHWWPFFDDGSIDQYQNSEAALCLIRWLAGRHPSMEASQPTTLEAKHAKNFDLAIGKLEAMKEMRPEELGLPPDARMNTFRDALGKRIGELGAFWQQCSHMAVFEHPARAIQQHAVPLGKTWTVRRTIGEIEKFLKHYYQKHGGKVVVPPPSSISVTVTARNIQGEVLKDYFERFDLVIIVARDDEKRTWLVYILDGRFAAGGWGRPPPSEAFRDMENHHHESMKDYVNRLASGIHEHIRKLAEAAVEK